MRRASLIEDELGLREFIYGCTAESVVVSMFEVMSSLETEG